MSGRKPDTGDPGGKPAPAQQKEYGWQIHCPRCRLLYGLVTFGAHPYYCIRCGVKVGVGNLVCTYIVVFEPDTADDWKREAG